MSNTTLPVTVRILDNEYRVACAEDKQESLLAAAEYLNAKMLEIRSSSKLLGIERIAVMAALNISYELLTCRQEVAELSDSTQEGVRALLNKVETALSKAT